MPRGGLAMASGALNVSIPTATIPTRSAARRMLLHGVVRHCHFSRSHHRHRNIEAVFVATAWAFIAGCWSPIGSTAADVGVISLVCIVVYAAAAAHAAPAAEAGALALCGGLLQTALSIALWPVNRYDPERRALGNLFLELAGAAGKAAQAASAPPGHHRHTQAQDGINALGSDNSVECLRLPRAAQPGKSAFVSAR